MSKSILIIGESGSGKTTSLRNLNPKETYYIDCDQKGLSWKKWKESYSLEKKNFFKTNSIDTVKGLIASINSKAPHIKYLVIDTLNSLMVADEMKRTKEKGYDKWVDLAASIYDVVQLINTLREDLTVICIAHSETITDEFGNKFTRIKTNGQKLNKIVLESFFTSVLLTKKHEGVHLFETKSNYSTAKTPFGTFEESEIVSNDINIVLEELKEL